MSTVKVQKSDRKPKKKARRSGVKKVKVEGGRYGRGMDGGNESSIDLPNGTLPDFLSGPRTY
jgi:hypothetical protein